MKKKIIATSFLIFILISCLSTSTFASYQVRPNYNPLVSTPAPTFWYNIRLMEAKDGPLGLDMEINETNVYQGYGSNNIDVHMIKNSEYGATAILAISAYGAGSYSSVNSTKYTTGNYTGIYGMGNEAIWCYTTTFTSVNGVLNADNSGKTNVNSNVKALLDKGIASKYYDQYDVTGITSSSMQSDFYALNYGDSATIKHVRRWILRDKDDI